MCWSGGEGLGDANGHGGHGLSRNPQGEAEVGFAARAELGAGRRGDAADLQKEFPAAPFWTSSARI